MDVGVILQLERNWLETEKGPWSAVEDEKMGSLLSPEQECKVREGR